MSDDLATIRELRRQVASLMDILRFVVPSKKLQDFKEQEAYIVQTANAYERCIREDERKRVLESVDSELSRELNALRVEHRDTVASLNFHKQALDEKRTHVHHLNYSLKVISNTYHHDCENPKDVYVRNNNRAMTLPYYINKVLELFKED